MGFEPTVRYKRTQHFQCCALNHLDHLSIGVLKSHLSIIPRFSKKARVFSKFSKKSIPDPNPANTTFDRRQNYERQTIQKSGYYS